MRISLHVLSLLIAIVGGGIGLVLARGMVAQDITSELLLLYLPAPALLIGAVIALITGTLAGLISNQGVGGTGARTIQLGLKFTF